MSVQKQVVDALMKPEAYDETVSEIELMQTHISFVFLAGKFVYKVKKAVDFGFLDFTTLEKRRFFCEKELELNKRLCEDMYLEVVPINKANAIRIKGAGETIEYAVKMKRMPQERMMSRLLDEGKIDSQFMDKLAQVIANFHAKGETNKHISTFGSFATIETNWKENFVQTEAYIGKTISAEAFKLIRSRVNAFMKRNVPLFEKRIAEGKIRDCHGDIHSGDIFVTDKIYIFDAIEVNERFRYSDVAADVSFLAMDADFRGRTDLSTSFIKSYIKYSGDEEVTRLLPFYKCYRAYVRGKVVGFKLNDPNVRSNEKKAAMNEAKAYIKLAATYAKGL